MRLEDLQGHRFGRYQIIGLLGRGGMAAVYRAHDTALRRDVALKILYPQYADDAALVERFQREAVLAANLDHQNILPIYDVGEADGLVYIAMRLLNGPSFADMLRMRGSLPPAELIPIIDQVAAALDYAHARQIVHRDIKPANILIEGLGAGDWGLGAANPSPQLPIANPRAVLTDFGIAKSLDPMTTGLTVSGVLIGTPEYMAPEQIHGRGAIDARADVYALGVLVYRALTGRRPFEGGTQEVLIGHLQGTAPAPSSIEPSLPTAIDAVVRKALARDPAQRYSSAGAFARALRDAAGMSLETPPPAMRREMDGRAVVPRIAIDDITRANPDLADQVTRKGTIRPHEAHSATPTQRQPSRVAQKPAERSSGPVAWVILGIVLAIVIGGGMIYAAGVLGGIRSNVGGLIASASPTEAATPPAAPTEAPTIEVPTSVPAPTAEATAAPTAAPTAAATTAVPPTQAPTVRPSARPTVRPSATATSTLAPTATQTASPSPSPSTTPSPTATPSATPTATPTVELKGGFKLLLDTHEGLRGELGNPLKPESGGLGTATEQQFETGSMFYFQPEERIYVLVGRDLGTWQAFEQKELQKLSAPPPANCPAPQQGGFALVWGHYQKVQQQLGCSIGPEPSLFEGAFQPFENGTMIYSQKGLGRGKTIYVLFVDGTFTRYDDLNP